MAPDGSTSSNALGVPKHDVIERAPTPHSVTNRRLEISQKKHRKYVASPALPASESLFLRRSSRSREGERTSAYFMTPSDRPSAPLQIVFVGIAVRERPDLEDKGTEYAVSVSDGSGIVQVRSANSVQSCALQLADKPPSAERAQLPPERRARTSGSAPHPRLGQEVRLAARSQGAFSTRLALE